jgi:hypothetical protein
MNMASAVATQHLKSRMLIQVWDHDPNTASAIVTTPDGGTTDRYVDMRDYSHFAAIAIQTVIGSSSGITKLEIIAASDTAGTDLVVIKDSGTVDADALADWLVEECSAEEVAFAADAAGTDLRYVAARVTQSNSGDEAIVVYLGESKRPCLNLTPATTIS